jgi:hypothetical protein
MRCIDQIQLAAHGPNRVASVADLHERREACVYRALGQPPGAGGAPAKRGTLRRQPSEETPCALLPGLGTWRASPNYEAGISGVVYCCLMSTGSRRGS